MLPGGQLSQVVSPALLVNVPEVQGVGEGLAERGHMNPGSRVDEKNSVCKTCSFFLYRKGVRNNWEVVRVPHCIMLVPRYSMLNS